MEFLIFQLIFSPLIYLKTGKDDKIPRANLNWMRYEAF